MPRTQMDSLQKAQQVCKSEFPNVEYDCKVYPAYLIGKASASSQNPKPKCCDYI